MTLEDLDDAWMTDIRAARPQAPASLEHDILRRLARPRRIPVIVGAVVAVAAIACIVVLARGGGEQPIDAPIVSTLPPDAPPADRPTHLVPPLPPEPEPPDWQHLTALFAKLDRDHGGTIRLCGGTGAIRIDVQRQRDGRARVTHPLLGIGYRGPTPLERCRVKAVTAIALPSMPAGLLSISFSFPLTAEPAALHAYEDPLAMIESQLGMSDIASCVYARSKLIFVVDRELHNPRTWLPKYQFQGQKDGGYSKIACAAKVFGKQPLPPLPSFVAEIQAQIEIKK